MRKKCDKTKIITRKLFPVARARARRAAIFAIARRALRKPARKKAPTFSPLVRGYDPELLFVECGRCGSPVLWEPGKATELLSQAGIDPLELDASCMLVTDACPACGSQNEYSVRVFRVTSQNSVALPPTHGHA